MEYKKAVAVLMELLDKYTLDEEEREAVLTAVGLFDWASIAKNRMKDKIKSWKEKKEKDIEWK